MNPGKGLELMNGCPFYKKILKHSTIFAKVFPLRCLWGASFGGKGVRVSTTPASSAELIGCIKHVEPAQNHQCSTKSLYHFTDR